MFKRYIRNLLIGFDQLVNAILGGDPDETISSRAGKNYPTAKRIINRLFFWQPKHCESSIETDEGLDSVIK